MDFRGKSEEFEGYCMFLCFVQLKLNIYKKIKSIIIEANRVGQHKSKDPYSRVGGTCFESEPRHTILTETVAVD
jgi:hypothetical protein